MIEDIPALPTAPKDVIEHIRRFEFGIGASLDGDGRVIVANTQRRYQSLLGTVAEDLNSKESHFILELIQNADDNTYDKGVDPSLLFIVDRQRLVVVNNEAGFLPKHVAALCSAGESSKKRKIGYIGEKGIGFKSVFKVTDAPEIHSNGFHFRFNRTDPKNVLGYVVPHWKEPDFPLDDRVTTLVLPARPPKEFPTELLKDLEPSLLLFLGKLRRIEVKTSAEHVEYVRRDSGSVTTLTTARRRSDGTSEHKERSFFRTSATHDMSGIVEPKRKDVFESDIVLAFPLSDKGEAAPDPNCPVYAFLPIRDFNFAFCIQADFVLTSSREGVHEDSEWNIRLRDQIAPGFIEALESFKANPRLANTYLRFLPEKGAVHDRFFRPVVDCLEEALRKTQSVPVEGGKWRKPDQVLIASQAVKDLFSSTDALTLFGAEYPSPSFEASTEQLGRIGCKTLTISDVVCIFREHAAWFQKKPLEWKARFYAYLASPQRLSEYIKLLRDVACIPTADGQLVSPKGETVFFPLSKKGKSRYDFEHELTVLDSEIYSAALEASSDVSALFEGLGVKPDNPYALIREHILDRHSRQDLGDDHRALVGHLRYVRDKLDLYLAHAASLGQPKQAALQVLSTGLFVGTHQAEGCWLFDHPSKLYLSKAYRPAFDIESLLGDQISPALLVSEAYIAKKRGAEPEDISSELDAWRQFFYDIGVNQVPLLNLNPGRAECSNELKALLGSPDNGVRRATLECLDRNWQVYEGHLTAYQKIGRQYNNYYTSFWTELRSTRAPTKRKVSVPLPQTYLDDPAIRAVLGGNAVFVDADLRNSRFLDATGITYKVDASACLKRLGQIRDNKGGANRDQVRAIYRQLETLWSSERSVIETAFALHPLIMIGVGESASWVRPKDACWQPTSVKVLDAVHVPLQSQYSEHRTFFTKQLDVPLELPLSKWVDALSRLSDVEGESERKSFALTIYRRLNRELGPPPKRVPDWIHRFSSEPLFMDHRGCLVRKSESLFANDDPEYARLFEDDESISLLAVPHDQLSSVVHLLAQTGIPRVSASLSIKPVGEPAGEVDLVLTKKVQDLFGCIARVVYSQSHDRFETAVKERLFEHLRALEVQVVPELDLEITLAGVKRTMSGDAAPRQRQLLLRAGAPYHVDHLAMEVRRILRLPQNQLATISVLLRSENMKDAEGYLRLTNVSQLPPDEQAFLDFLATEKSGNIGETRLDEECAGAGATTEPAEGDDTQPTSNKPPRSGADGDGGQGKPRTDSIAPSSTDHRGSTKLTRATKTEADASERNSSASTHPLEGTRAHGTSSGRFPVSSPDASTNHSDDNIGGAEVHSHATAFGTSTPRSGGTLGSPDELPQALAGTNSGSLGEPGEALTGQMHAKGTKRPTQRTKSGRLVSYTEPAKGASAAQDDEDHADPEVRKRRMAIEKAAVDYFVTMAGGRWRELTVIPNPTNPGFDVQAIAHDGIAEFIEVKGQSGAWNDTGVAVSPTQIRKAEQQRERFWLCVVEYATDDERRQLYLINNPFGLTDQFRFDKGWKGAATVIAARPSHPKEGMFVTLVGEGKARIIGVRGNGRLLRIDYQFLADGQKRFNKVFQPNTMTLSVD